MARLAALLGMIGPVEAWLVSCSHPIVTTPARQAALYVGAYVLYLALAAGVLAVAAPVARLLSAHPRRPLTLVALATAGGAALVLPARHPAPLPPLLAGLVAADPRPSLLMITVDTLRRDHVSAYDDRFVTTTTIDRVARRGTLFEQAFCQAPLTNPSHATILTGELPPRHGSRYNGVPARVGPQALAPLLRRHGYHTMAAVSSSVLSARMSGLGFGFTIYDDQLLPAPLSQQLFLLAPLRSLLAAAHRMPPERRARLTVERALGMLAEAAAGPQPLFLWVHLYDPHIPYHPPEPFAHQLDPDYTGDLDVDTRTVVDIREGRRPLSERDLAHGRRMYAAEVAYADAWLGPLLDGMERTGRPFVTVLTADHGESLGEHDYTFFHGENLFAPSMAVPLLLAGPGVPSGERVAPLVRLVDLMPTILELLRVPAPAGLDGRSLVPLLHGRRLPPLPSYGEDGDRLYMAPATGTLSLESKELALRSTRYNYVVRPATGAEQLYDLSADPSEDHNVAGDPALASVKAELRGTLQAITDFSGYGNGATAGAIDEPETLETLEQLGYVERREGRGEPPAATPSPDERP